MSDCQPDTSARHVSSWMTAGIFLPHRPVQFATVNSHTIQNSHTADFHFLTMHIARTYWLWSELHI